MRARFPGITVIAVLVPLLILWLLAGVRPLRAQSLAEVAKQEEARRKALKDTGRTITNKDLPRAPSTSAGASKQPAAAASDATDASDKAKDADASGKDAKDGSGATGKDGKDGKDAKDADQPKDQKYWGDRMKTLQAAVDRDGTVADALQTRISSLTTDFVNRDDPAQRSVVAQNKQKAIDELARLKQTLADDKKAIADLEDEARRANVPPGWLR